MVLNNLSLLIYSLPRKALLKTHREDILIGKEAPRLENAIDAYRSTLASLYNYVGQAVADVDD